jgi:hypothetical protein
LALARILIKIAAVSPPRSLPKNSQFFRDWTFLGSDRGGRTVSILYTMTCRCEHHDLDPFGYLDDILRRLPSQPAGELDELLPDVWFGSHPSARRKTPL